jgi:hypothetical protein
MKLSEECHFETQVWELHSKRRFHSSLFFVP